jgi:hypothetical protein
VWVLLSKLEKRGDACRFFYQKLEKEEVRKIVIKPLKFYSIQQSTQRRKV